MHNVCLGQDKGMPRGSALAENGAIVPRWRALTSFHPAVGALVVASTAILFLLAGCHPSPFSFRGTQTRGPAAGAAAFRSPGSAAPGGTGAAHSAPASTPARPAVGAAFRMIDSV